MHLHRAAHKAWVETRTLHGKRDGSQHMMHICDTAVQSALLLVVNHAALQCYKSTKTMADLAGQEHTRVCDARSSLSFELCANC